MRRNRIVLLSAALALTSVTVPVEGWQQPDSARIAELERRVEAVTRELERLRLGPDVVEADTSIHGFGPGASKVYRGGTGASIGGYGEALYQNYASERQDGSVAGVPNRVDAYRAIVYVGYRYDERLIFNSEIEVEHTDEIELEFAYLDYMLTEGIGVRAGLVLMPVGLINELHEPPTFLGTTRPMTETALIPTTWRENGVGIFGRGDDLDWRAYLVSGLDASGLSADGLRDARQEGAKALAVDPAVVGRVDWTGRPGLLLGLSGYYGRTGQGRTMDGAKVAAPLFLWDLHGEYGIGGFQLRALWARTDLGDVTALNRGLGLEGADAVAKGMRGGYLQVGYDVLRRKATTQQLIPYLRWERLNTQARVGPTFAADPARDRTALVLGAAWKPVPQVVAKVDWQRRTNVADSGLNQWNAALGWLF